MQAGHLPTWRSAFSHPQLIARALCALVAGVLIAIELRPAISARLETAAATHPRAAVQATTSIEQLTSADLFGHAAVQNSNLPQTDLQVTLRAVFAASDPKMASAVIETGEGNAQVVKVGGAIGSSATLHEVYPDRVVLSRNGALETLRFPTPQESSAISLAQNTEQPGAAPATTNNESSSPVADEVKRAAILQRLEELRARSTR